MEKFDIAKAIEEEIKEGDAGEAPLAPEEFKKIKKASSPEIKLPKELTEEKIKNLKRREPPASNRRDKAA